MKMIIYYSGEGGHKADPEYTLQEKANVMLTFAHLRKTVTKRFKAILLSRKKREAKSNGISSTI